MGSSMGQRAYAAGRSVAAAGLVWTVAVRRSGRTMRWSPAAVAFTPFAGLGTAVLAGLAALRRERATAAVLAAAAAQVAVWLVPRTRVVDQPVVDGGGRRLRVMSANVFKGRAEAAAVVALVLELQPDVLAMQEQNPRFVRELGEAGLFEVLPHRLIGDGGRLADGSLFSRYPLTPAGDDLPGEFVSATVDLPGGAPLPFICAHPLPPSSPRYEGPWIRSLERLPSPEGWMAGGIVAGDFNATLDHPEFRAILARGWRDAGSERGGGLRPTWGGYGVLRLTIDHVLVPPGAVVSDYRVDAVPGSDHRAITATIRLPPTAR